MTTVITAYRYTFNVINLPLDRELRCGELRIEPIPEGQEELEKRNSLDSESVVSAIGILSFPWGLDQEERWNIVHQQPLTNICLLLSFATRRFVEVENPRMERLEDGIWVTAGWEAHFPMYGRPHGVGWYLDHDELQAFLDCCLPVLSDPIDGREGSLTLALKLYRSNLQYDYEEVRYLKAWIALERLFSQKKRIMPSGRFRRVRRKIREVLVILLEEDQIRANESELILTKLPELNRPSATSECHAFLEEVFRPYPKQQVSMDDIKTFNEIRNHITHTGSMERRQEENYGDRLGLEYERLRSLLERVILALLNQNPNLMTVPWTHWIWPY